MITSKAAPPRTRRAVCGARWMLAVGNLVSPYSYARASARRSQSCSRAYVQHRESSSSATKPEVGVSSARTKRAPRPPGTCASRARAHVAVVKGQGSG